MDVLRPPNLRTLVLSIASKLKVPAASQFTAAGRTDGNRYQLLLNNQAVVEHVSELRDGDTVLLQVLGPSLSRPTDAVPQPEPSSTKKKSPPLQQEVICLDSSSSDEDRPATPVHQDAAPTDPHVAFAVRDDASPPMGPEQVTSQASSSPKKAPRKRPSHPGDDGSVDSVTTLAHSVVQEAAAAAKHIEVEDSTDESVISEGDKKVAAVGSAETAPQAETLRLGGVGIPPTDGDSLDTAQTVGSPLRSIKRKLRSSKKNKDDSLASSLAKRRKNASSTAGVRFSTHGQAEQEGIKPDEVPSVKVPMPPPRSKGHTKQAFIPDYALGKRYFLSYYDGHEYPVTVTGGVGRSKGTRRVELDVFKLKLTVRKEELLQVTEEREELWASSMPDSASVCSISSRSTRSTKSVDYQKFGPPTNTSQCRALAEKLRKSGYGDGQLQGRWLAQRNRIVYFCCDNETPRDVQKKFPRVSVGKILYDNRPTWGVALHKNSRMHTESFFVLPKAYRGRPVASSDNTTNEVMIPWSSCFSVASASRR